jgi:glycosyltransferase involved in cell wall biosynthesis
LFPFVTCLCLTRNRRQWLPQAIRCFLEQTYPSRELLILADGEDVSASVKSNGICSASALIRYVQIEDGRTVGEKRNIGSQLAQGQVVASWDDDDWSAPGRLADQVERLRLFGKAVTGYHSMPFTDGEQWWRYKGAANYALGTSLCYRKSWWSIHKFSAKQIGEDGDFAREADTAGQLMSVDAGELMVASIHKGNTSPRRLIGDQWSRVEASRHFPDFAIAL